MKQNGIQLRATVHEALFLTKSMQCTDGFVINTSCWDLEELGETALPAIESLLIKEVLPNYFHSNKSLARKFPGLSALLITYFAIAKDASDDRAFSFFRKLAGSVRIEAMRAIAVVWQKLTPTAPIPEPFIAAAYELAANGREVRQVAKLFLNEEGARQ